MGAHAWEVDEYVVEQGKRRIRWACRRCHRPEETFAPDGERALPPPAGECARARKREGK